MLTEDNGDGDGPSSYPVSKADAAGYIFEVLGGLRSIADQTNQAVLSRLLEATAAEAARNMHRPQFKLVNELGD